MSSHKQKTMADTAKPPELDRGHVVQSDDAPQIIGLDDHVGELGDAVQSSQRADRVPEDLAGWILRLSLGTSMRSRLRARRPDNSPPPQDPQQKVAGAA